jgi:hypothetical protein
MLRAALRYPTRDQDAVFTLLVGGGLHLLAVWIPVLPYVFVAGYLVRVLSHTTSGGRAALRDEAGAPRFDRPLTLLRDGVSAVVVAAVYLVVPVGILLVTVGGAVGGDLSLAAAGTGTQVGFLVGSTVTILVAGTVSYLVPAAVSLYALHGRVRAAFEWRSIRRAATDARYFYGVVAGLALATVAGVAVGPLNRLALGFFLAFYAEVVVTALVGRAAADALGDGGRRAAPDDAAD